MILVKNFKIKGKKGGQKVVEVCKQGKDSLTKWASSLAVYCRFCFVLHEWFKLIPTEFWWIGKGHRPWPMVALSLCARFQKIPIEVILTTKRPSWKSISLDIYSKFWLEKKWDDRTYVCASPFDNFRFVWLSDSYLCSPAYTFL